VSVWGKKPRRTTEIWKLERATNAVAVLGPEGLVRLNALGSAIWVRLDGTRALGELVAELATAYPELPRSRLELDVLAFFEYLVANRLAIPEWDPLGEAPALPRGGGP
jgi:coenzyme PQQ biosynthesis protein PqqD